MSIINSSSAAKLPDKNQLDNIPFKGTVCNSKLEIELRKLHKELGAEAALKKFTDTHPYLPSNYIETLFIREILPHELTSEIEKNGERGIQNFTNTWDIKELSWKFSLDEVVRDAKKLIYKRTYKASGEPTASNKMESLFPSGLGRDWQYLKNAMQEEVHKNAITDVILERQGVGALFLVYDKFKIEPDRQRYYERKLMTPLIELEARQAFTSGGPEAVAKLLSDLEIPSNSAIANRLRNDLEYCGELRARIALEGAAGAERFRVENHIKDEEWDRFYNPHVRVPQLGALLIEELERNGSENLLVFKERYLINEDDWQRIEAQYVEPFICEMCRETTLQLGWEDGLEVIHNRFNSFNQINPDSLFKLLIERARNEINNSLSDNFNSAKSILEIQEQFAFPEIKIWNELLTDTALPWFRKHLSDIYRGLQKPIYDLDKAVSSVMQASMIIENLESPEWLVTDQEVKEYCKSMVDFIEKTKPEMRMAGIMRKIFNISSND